MLSPYAVNIHMSGQCGSPYGPNLKQRKRGDAPCTWYERLLCRASSRELKPRYPPKRAHAVS